MKQRDLLWQISLTAEKGGPWGFQPETDWSTMIRSYVSSQAESPHSCATKTWQVSISLVRNTRSYIAVAVLRDEVEHDSFIGLDQLIVRISEVYVPAGVMPLHHGRGTKIMASTHPKDLSVLCLWWQL